MLRIELVVALLVVALVVVVLKFRASGRSLGDVVSGLRIGPQPARVTVGGPAGALPFAASDEAPGGGGSAPASTSAPASNRRVDAPPLNRTRPAGDFAGDVAIVYDVADPGSLRKAPLADLLVYGYDAGNNDACEAVAEMVSDLAQLLDSAMRDTETPPTDHTVSRVLSRIERGAGVYRELHRRQIEALLAAQK